MPDFQVLIPAQGDRKRTLRAALRARLHLQERLGAAIGETSLRGVHWLEPDRAYFEFRGISRDIFENALQDLRVENAAITGIVVSTATENKGDPCLNCGNIAGGTTPPICPSCNFQEISQCPYCSQLSSRNAYTNAEGKLLRCPNCRRRVRMRFNDPLFTSKGDYRPPVVVVERPEGEQ